MTMISFAQNHEDVVLDRAFPRGKSGFYIDVGANEPVMGSVTKHFYDLGWQGINIEPSATAYAALSEARTRDVNLNVGLSDVAGELSFFEFPESAISTFSPEAAERMRLIGKPAQERKVPTMTLAEVCERYVGDRTIDFLSVDVEGHELEVLAGADWTRWRPRVVLVEAIEPGTTVPSHEAWEPVLLEAGYQFVAFDGLNRFYVRKEDAELAPMLAVPASVMDVYVPYGYQKLVEDLKHSVDALQRTASATRAMNVTLLGEVDGFSAELGALRQRYERLERALTGARAECESLRREMEEGRGQVEQLEDQVRASNLLPDGVSPSAVGVARRLTALSSQHPKAASSVKKVLRLGLRTKRALTNRLP